MPFYCGHPIVDHLVVGLGKSVCMGIDDLDRLDLIPAGSLIAGLCFFGSLVLLHAHRANTITRARSSAKNLFITLFSILYNIFSAGRAHRKYGIGFY